MTAKRASVIHHPRLDTVLMVEDFIREHGGEYRKKTLWKSLPRKMMYQTFMVIIDYLESSGKIAFDKKGNVCWIWNPELVKRYTRDAGLSIR